MMRLPAVAGTFYPANPTELAKQLKTFLNKPPQKITGKLRAIIVPHAGYIYSGAIAGNAFQLLQNQNRQNPPTNWEILLLGPSHVAAFDGASVSLAEKWQTPLGSVLVSARAREFISPLIQNIEELHWNEHCLEVEIPFLQQTLSHFCIVPIVLGQINPAALAIELEAKLQPNTIIVVSSDLSHYHPYGKASALDRQTIQFILDLNTEQMETKGEACGQTPILTLMHMAKQKKWTTHLLNYKNSGDTAGNQNRVVGYAAIAFTEH